MPEPSAVHLTISQVVKGKYTQKFSEEVDRYVDVTSYDTKPDIFTTVVRIRHGRIKDVIAGLGTLHVFLSPRTKFEVRRVVLDLAKTPQGIAEDECARVGGAA